MERYAEFIGANSADHVITQALEFVFKKDSDFRDWLEKNPARSSGSTLRKAKCNPTQGELQEPLTLPRGRKPYDSARSCFKRSRGLCARLRNRADSLLSMALPSRMTSCCI